MHTDRGVVFQCFKYPFENKAFKKKLLFRGGSGTGGLKEIGTKSERQGENQWNYGF